MTRPCDVCGGFPAGFYPAGWRCATCAPAPAAGVAYTPMPPGNRVRSTADPGPCRYCHRPAWGADELGAVHDCCLAWQHVIAAGHPCPACQVAVNVLKQLAAIALLPPEKRGAVRLPVLPPLPALLPDGTPYVPEPPPAPRCAACRQRMTVIMPGQRAHPLCAEDWAAPPREEAA